MAINELDFSNRLTLDWSLPSDATFWSKHLYQNAMGEFPERLNKWETATLNDEMARPGFAGWLRNREKTRHFFHTRSIHTRCRNTTYLPIKSQRRRVKPRTLDARSQRRELRRSRRAEGTKKRKKSCVCESCGASRGRRFARGAVSHSSSSVVVAAVGHQRVSGCGRRRVASDEKRKRPRHVGGVDQSCLSVFFVLFVFSFFVF